MKEKFQQLLKTYPSTAKMTDEFIDNLAEDICALILRALSPASTDDALAALEHETDEVWQSNFGVEVFNLYTIKNFPGKKDLPFSVRKRVVRAMFQALLVEQCVDYDCALEVAPDLLDRVHDGPTLKRRLIELNQDPSNTIN
jgi:hypothetical protein